MRAESKWVKTSMWSCFWYNFKSTMISFWTESELLPEKFGPGEPKWLDSRDHHRTGVARILNDLNWHDPISTASAQPWHINSEQYKLHFVNSTQSHLKPSPDGSHYEPYANIRNSEITHFRCFSQWFAGIDPFPVKTADRLGQMTFQPWSMQASRTCQPEKSLMIDSDSIIAI